MANEPNLSQHTVFGCFFIGAFLVALVSFSLFWDVSKLPQTTLQWGALTCLGIVESGVGYFAWNKGATLVNVGTLAVMNNLLIPIGILVNVLIWNREADIVRLSIGSGIILLALLINQKIFPNNRMKVLS